MTYPDTRVGALVHDAFQPVQITVGSLPDLDERYQIHWTPTILILDGEGRPHHRSVGFLRPNEFCSMLLLGLGKFHFDRHEWDLADDALARLIHEDPSSFFAPEAHYWRGVVAYKGRNDVPGLRRHWGEVERLFPDTEWAAKVSFLFA